jgi:Arylsulfotransferase (ASST)
MNWRTTLILMTAALLSAATAALMASARAEPSIYPTGVTRYDPTKAHNTFILFSGADEKTHLIDMNGNEVHRWDYDGSPSGLLDPALTDGQRGQVMVWLAKASDNETSPGLPAIFQARWRNLYGNKTIGVVDWNGKIVWQWGEHAPGDAAQQHHDWSRLPNGNTLVLSILNHAIPGFVLPRSLDDAIYEVAPNGEIVWRWIAADHLDEFGFTAESLALVRQSKLPDYLHLNSMKPVGPNHWFREGDARFNTENIIISSREANVIAIIAKQTGQIVWRLGPTYAASPAGPRRLPAVIDQISGQHDPQIIPEGLPGAGNLLVFDNQGEAGYPAAELRLRHGSRVLEIDPVKEQIIWEYTGGYSDLPDWTFHSSFISDARRLPNGNTFIDEGMNGRFFQVTPAGEIVWEYVSPYFGREPYGPAGKMVLSKAVYRAQPVPYDWVPAGIAHGERAVAPPDLSTYQVPAQR